MDFAKPSKEKIRSRYTLCTFRKILSISGSVHCTIYDQIQNINLSRKLTFLRFCFCLKKTWPTISQTSNQSLKWKYQKTKIAKLAVANRRFSKKFSFAERRSRCFSINGVIKKSVWKKRGNFVGPTWLINRKICKSTGLATSVANLAEFFQMIAN